MDFLYNPIILFYVLNKKEKPHGHGPTCGDCLGVGV